TTEEALASQTVLLFATRTGGRMALPLSLIDRLEEFPRSAIEHVGPFEVVQYRNEILPLMSVSRLLRERSSTSDGRSASRRRAGESPRAHEGDIVQVVVCSVSGRRIGLVVDRILDIAEATLANQSPSQRPGVLFTAVVQDRVTEFLDLE